MKTFNGKLLKRLRNKYNLTQKELGLGIGVTDMTISRWEIGERSPSGRHLIELSVFFGVKPETFYKEKKMNADDKEHIEQERRERRSEWRRTNSDYIRKVEENDWNQSVSDLMDAIRDRW